MAWKPNIVTRQAIEGFISDLFATAPEIMGIDEAISACEVILMDPYTTGTLPRYIRVRIRQFYQDVMWRGAPSLVVGDFCTVLHFRDGNRYEVIGASGAGGIDLVSPYLYIWVYDVSEGLLIPYDTINGALAYGLLAAGDFVLIPPGTFDETITLVNGVFICEQIPGTVTLHYTGAADANSGTVVVADGGYLNIRNIYRTVDGDCNAVYAAAPFTGECVIIVENIDADGAASGNFIRGVKMRLASGTLHLYAKNITATSPGAGSDGTAVWCWYGNGTINLYVEQGYGTGPDWGYGIFCGGNLANGGFTVNAYGGVWEGLAAAGDAGIYCTSYGVVTALHAKAVGSIQDIHITGTGVIYIFQVQYDTTTGTPTHLPGDHIVLDLDTDTYITALAADDRIDLFVAGAPPTDFKFGPNNVITVLNNIAQAFSIVDAGALEYIRIVSTDANPYFLINPAGVAIQLGVGIAAPDALYASHFYETASDRRLLKVEGVALDFTTSYIGALFTFTKTAGATDHDDTFYGTYTNAIFNQPAGEIGFFYGGLLYASLVDGNVGDAVNSRYIIGQIANANLDGGKVWGTAMGLWAQVDQEAANEVTIDIRGLSVWVDAAGTVGGNVYLLYLNAGVNVDYGVYQLGAIDNYFAGSVGIGMLPTYRLDVTTNHAAGWAGGFFNDGDNVNRYGVRIQCGDDDADTAGTAYHLIFYDGDGGGCGGVRTVAGVTAIYQTSDEKLKKDVRPTIRKGVEEISALPVRDFKWKKGKKTDPFHTGFVAQEVEKVIPRAVGELDDIKTLSTAYFIPMLVKAVQELDVRLSQVEAH